MIKINDAQTLELLTQGVLLLREIVADSRTAEVQRTKSQRLLARVYAALAPFEAALVAEAGRRRSAAGKD